MTVNIVKPNMLCLEYRQEKEDKDYGSCLWARFTFNLDRYELTITSDCGIYGYKWVETPKSESFLELMARCDEGYILDKIYGSPDVFDYEKTKKLFYEYADDDNEKKELDRIFAEIEWCGYPHTEDEFIRVFEEESSDYDNVWEYIQYSYPANALKIVSVFDECIRQKIEEIIKN